MSEPKKRPKKKVVKKELPSSPSQNLDLTKLDQTKIEQLFQQTALRYKQDLELDKKIKLKEMSQLTFMAEEYLNSFLILGYSTQDERVVLWNARTAKDEAALVDLLRTTCMDILSK